MPSKRVAVLFLPEEMSTEPSFLEGLCDCDERLGRETSRIRAWVSPS